MTGARVARLVLADGRELDLNDSGSTGVIVDTIDVGFPVVREVTTDLPEQDGEFDETENFSARIVSISGVAYPVEFSGSRAQILDGFAPFLNPKARPQLIYAFDEDVEERAFTLRVQQGSAPISSGRSSAFQYQWKCPDPIAYGLDTNEVDIPPAAGASTGRTYPLTFPRVYPAGYGGSGQSFVGVGGTYPTWALLRIFGPCVDPAIYWLDPETTDPLGIQVVLSGITVDEGDYLEIDTKARTVLLNGDPGANRYSFVDFANTVWGPLQPVMNLLRFQVSSADVPAIAQVLFRNAYL